MLALTLEGKLRNYATGIAVYLIVTNTASAECKFPGETVVKFLQSNGATISLQTPPQMSGSCNLVGSSVVLNATRTASANCTFDLFDGATLGGGATITTITFVGSDYVLKERPRKGQANLHTSGSLTAPAGETRTFSIQDLTTTFANCPKVDDMFSKLRLE